MRNFKKMLSVLVAVVMLATTMVPAFAAASYTYEAQANALNDMGLLKGVATEPDVFNPDLGGDMTREAGIVMMLRLVGKTTESEAISTADVDAALANYTDASKIADWAKKPVAYAIKNNLVSGMTTTTIEPQTKFVGKMFATIILRNVGYTIDAVSYDVACVTMSEKGGLTTAEAIKFNTKQLIRDDMAGMSYGALKLQYAATAKTIIETLVADGKVDRAKAIKYNFIIEVAQTMVATQTGAKTITAKFTAPVDASKLAISVKKGTIALNYSTVTVSEDKMSAKIEFITDLTSGDFTVTAAGITTDALTATVTAEQSKVAKVDFTSSFATPKINSEVAVTTGYKITNQYAEDITAAKEGEFNFTASKGSIATLKGVMTLTVVAPDKFAKDDKLTVTALHGTTGVFDSEVLTVVEKPQVADLKIVSLYNKDKATLSVNSSYSDYALVVEAKDQFGNNITDTAFLTDSVIVNVTSPSVLTVLPFSTTVIDDTTKVILTLVAPTTKTAGTSAVSVISKHNGKMATFEVVVKDKSKVDALSFQTPAFPVAGDSKIEIPFTAVDQFGVAVTDATILNNVAKPSFSNSTLNSKVGYEYDPIKDVTKLYLDASALTGAETVILTAQSETNKFTTTSISFAAPAVATVIAGLKDVATTLHLGAVESIEAKEVIVRDQYGRDMSAEKVATLSVTLATYDSSYLTNTINVITSTNKIDLTAVKKGTSVISLKIAGKDSSAYQTSITVVDKTDISSYEVSPVANVYAGIDKTALHTRDIKVYGLLASGAKVEVPNVAANYEVVVNSAKLNVTGIKVSSALVTPLADDKTEVVPVVVTIKGATTTIVKTVNVTLTGEKAVATTIVLVTATNIVDGVVYLNVAAANTAIADTKAFAAANTVIKDQYGIAMTSALEITAGIATNVPTTVAAATTFNVTVVTNNAKVLSFSVRVTQ